MSRMRAWLAAAVEHDWLRWEFRERLEAAGATTGEVLTWGAQMAGVDPGDAWDVRLGLGERGRGNVALVLVVELLDGTTVQRTLGAAASRWILVRQLREGGS